MKTLVVGGTGMIGCHAATLLADQGHEVTIAARSAPAAQSPVAAFPVVLGDYAAGELGEGAGGLRGGRLCRGSGRASCASRERR